LTNFPSNGNCCRHSSSHCTFSHFSSSRFTSITCFGRPSGLLPKHISFPLDSLSFSVRHTSDHSEQAQELTIVRMRRFNLALQMTTFMKCVPTKKVTHATLSLLKLILNFNPYSSSLSSLPLTMDSTMATLVFVHQRSTSSNSPCKFRARFII